MMKKYYEKVGRYKFCIEVVKEKCGIMTCHIPAYDLFYNAKDEEMIKKKGKFMTMSFFNFHDIKY